MRRTMSLCAAYLGLAIIAGIAAPQPARSGPNANARVLIDLQQSQLVDPTPCASGMTHSCSEANTAGDLNPPSVYRSALLLLADGNAQAGIGGLSCALRYDGQPGSGVDLLDWHPCGSGPLVGCMIPPCFPESGIGTIITWDHDNLCQRSEPGGPGTGVVAIAGYFYLAAYSPDTLAVVAHPSFGQVTVADCSAQEDAILPLNLGSVVFSSGALVSGHNPCVIDTPVQPSTWGGIKNLY